MVSKKYWENSIKDFISVVRQVIDLEQFEMQGLSFVALPMVFSPKYSSDTEWFAQKIIPLIKNKAFLEIGSGTGAIACLAANNYAKCVVATDINPHAVENIAMNAKNNNLNVSVRQGSVLDPISVKEKFDIIFWNHPFYYTHEKLTEDSWIETAVCDINYESLKKFFRQGKLHLTKHGRIILGTSNIARLNVIKKIALTEGYKIVSLEKREVPVYKGKRTKMDIRLYVFSN
jgi:release factor glutamine methyltransferase